MTRHSNRRLRLRLLIPALLAMAAGSQIAVGIAEAATPGSGTISPTALTKTWVGKTYTGSVTPDSTVCPDKSADPNNTICDHYTLTVNVTSSYWTTHQGGADVTISWPSSNDDFDLYVYKGSALVGSSAQGSTTSEKVSIEKATGTYEVRVVPFLVTSSGYDGTAKFVTRAGGTTPPPLGRAWKYHGTRITGALPATEPKNVPTTDKPGLAPLELKLYNVGRKSAEPTVAVDKQGRAFYASATFDGPGGLADTKVRRSLDEGRTWGDATPDVDLPITLDPYLYVEEDTGRLFNLDLYVANSFISFSDDGGNTYMTSPCGSSCTDTVNDHQTLFAGPLPADSPLTTVGFPEALYYCFNRVGDTSCTRSVDGGLTFVNSGAPAYLGINPNSGVLCGGLSGQVAVDKLGNVFLPRNYGPGQVLLDCNEPFVAVSQNAGLTWKRVRVSGTVGLNDNQSAIASDAKNNLYYVWWDSKFKLPFLATSTDHGFHWSKPLMIAPPNVREAQWPTVAAGANGKVAISFPGTTQSNQSDLTRPWDYYVVTSQDALAANPTFVSNIANPATDPVHRGDCPGRCGNMLDFLDLVISPAPGHAIWASVVDTCTTVQSCKSNPNAKGFDDGSGDDNTAADMQGLVARQVTGRPDLGPPGTCRTCS